MIYSVYRPELGVYDYYETSEQTAKNPETPFLIGRGGSQLGLASTDAGWPLPANAVKVGSGARARGMVATRNGGGLGGISVPGGGLGFVALVAGAWWWLKGRK